MEQRLKEPLKNLREESMKELAQKSLNDFSRVILKETPD